MFCKHLNHFLMFTGMRFIQHYAEIWVSLKRWFYQETGSALTLIKVIITWISASRCHLFQGRGAIAFSPNAIILVSKSHIFKCLKESYKPSFNALQLLYAI